MMDEKLKPCPFCGNTPTFCGWGWISIRCMPCDIEIKDERGDRDNPHEVARLIKRWNKRA